MPQFSIVMNHFFKQLARYNLIIFLLVLFSLPLFLSLFLMINKEAMPPFIRSGYKLHGLNKELNVIPFTIKNFKSHEFQKYVEDFVANKLPLRSFFIRMNDQLYYSLLKKSYLNNSQVIIGKSNQLFEYSYIDDYCKKNVVDINKLKLWADHLKELSDFFKRQNKVFIYLITPSKAEYMPENIPSRFSCKGKGSKEALAQLSSLLRERKVLFVNAADQIYDAKSNYAIPLFSTGGTHWNSVGASIAANSIIALLNQSFHQSISKIKLDYQVATDPIGTDRDLLDLLNLLKPNDQYKVPLINHVKTNHYQTNYTLSCIGGSFLGQVLALYYDYDFFPKITYYYYFKIRKLTYGLKQISAIEESELDTQKLVKELVKSNIIVLEENSSKVASTNHAALFYDVMKKIYLF